jgi:hypothetical protein
MIEIISTMEYIFKGIIPLVIVYSLYFRLTGFLKNGRIEYKKKNNLFKTFINLIFLILL